MTYALIGCGRIAVNHIKAALNNKLNIVAVCDVLPEKMEELLTKYVLQNDDSIARYTDYKKLLAEHPDLQLASIATESGIHAEIALACIDAGVNVIIEKPMAMRMDDANEIIRRSEEKHVKVAACHQNRFNVAVQEMRHALEPESGLLRSGTVAGHLGAGRRLPDEPVHPWHRPAALDDGGRGGRGLRRHPPAVP